MGKLACCFSSQSEARHGKRRGRAWDGEIKSANIHCRGGGRRVAGSMVRVRVSSSSPPPCTLQCEYESA